VAGNNNKPSRTRGKTARGGVARALAVLLGAAAAGTAGMLAGMPTGHSRWPQPSDPAPMTLSQPMLFAPVGEAAPTES
jgi:hypothetical protein